MHNIDINHGDFRRLDLNLLVALDALLLEGHVGRAADRLFIGQPAMSHALARLRTLFNDELLVRTGKGMEPTALAQTLGPRVRAWLNEGRDFLREEPFDLARVQGVFRVSIPDALETLVMPALMPILRAQAPGLILRVA
ncbi:MAG TPA: LysR family transcriptional regulator, partial [Aquabacterium sp.]|nr:LysR family transcriptional regulator [Aquabacterium sp.]